MTRLTSLEIDDSDPSDEETGFQLPQFTAEQITEFPTTSKDRGFILFNITNNRIEYYNNQGMLIGVVSLPITTADILNFHAAVTAFRLDQFAVPTALLDIGNQSLTNVSDPANAQDAATKNYVDNTTAAAIDAITLTGFVDGTTSSSVITTTRGATCLLTNIPAGGNVDMGDFRITDLLNPVNPQDAATKDYVDSIGGGGSITLTGAVTGSGTGTIVTTLTPITTSQISNFNTSVLAFRLDEFAAPTSAVSMNSQKITNVLNPTAAQDVATKDYVDNLGNDTITLTGAVIGSGTGTIATTLTPITTSQISDFSTSVLAFRLDQFAVPTAAVSMNSQKITNVANPTAAQDVATKDYVDSAGGGSITLTGAVTGSGTGTIATTLTPITTSQISDFNASVTAFRLDEFAAPTSAVSMNSQKITNVLNPTAAQDVATKDYVDNLGNDTITLTGAVTGSGTGTIATTLTPITTSQISDFNTSVTAFRLDEFAAPTSAVSMNSQKITNVANPTAAQDVATKDYVDSAGGGSITLTGAVTGSGTGTIATTLTPITTSQISNFNASVTAFRLDEFATPTAVVSMGSQRITNVSPPAVGTDATNKTYVDTEVKNLPVAFVGVYDYTTNLSFTAGVNRVMTDLPFTLATTSRWFEMIQPGRLRSTNPGNLNHVVSITMQVLNTSGSDLDFTVEIIKNQVVNLVRPKFTTRLINNEFKTITVESEPVNLVNGVDTVEMQLNSSSTTSLINVRNISYTVTHF